MNYAYYLSAAIYKWIETSSREYSTFLHNKGYSPEGTAKRFKHFCFSRLLPRESRVDTKAARLILLSPEVEWYVSMPVEQSLQHLVTGMFEKRELFIESEANRFLVEQVETMPEPHWQRRMTFTMLSPTTVSTMVEHNGKLQPYYLRPDDERLPDALRTNILNKYKSLYGGGEGAGEGFLQRGTSSEEGNLRQGNLLRGDTAFRCTLDQSYIERQKAKGRRITQKITIKEGRTDASEIIGFTCPLKIEGNPELLALAYESGLGEKNSLGFGMLESV
ncbi:MAG: CRISPR-associated endoribonuclease Cas6 [Bacteroidetes bacterium]|nr:CRISPR-associated endoribonuclease Cas6 [Bacteroidota bacterium]